MHFKNKNYFREPYFATEEFDAEDFRIEKLELLSENLKNKTPGLNGNKERCIKGVEATYYVEIGLIFTPIIFNLDTKKVSVDYKAMDKIDAKEHFDRLKDSLLYKSKENICYIFYDGKVFHEFLYTRKSKPPHFTKSLNHIFENFQK